MTTTVQDRRAAALHTPSALSDNAVKDLAASLTGLLADCFALYLKTKNFHWHMSGPHFRDYHLLLDEQADQIFAMTDPIAERVTQDWRARRCDRSADRAAAAPPRQRRQFVPPGTMLAELRDDNRQLTAILREVHALCDELGDVATASLVEVWIDEAERRTWFCSRAPVRQAVDLLPDVIAGSPAQADVPAPTPQGHRGVKS